MRNESHSSINGIGCARWGRSADRHASELSVERWHVRAGYSTDRTGASVELLAADDDLRLNRAIRSYVSANQRTVQHADDTVNRDFVSGAANACDTIGDLDLVFGG